MNATLNAELKFVVVGNHPILGRPDRVFKGEGAETAANGYANKLRMCGYENVEVKQRKV